MSVGKSLLLLGLVLACAGVVVMVLEKVNLPVGKLPGDLLWRRGGTTIYVPLGTCFLLSVAASLLLWLLSKR